MKTNIDITLTLTDMENDEWDRYIQELKNDLSNRPGVLVANVGPGYMIDDREYTEYIDTL